MLPDPDAMSAEGGQRPARHDIGFPLASEILSHAIRKGQIANVFAASTWTVARGLDGVRTLHHFHRRSVGVGPSERGHGGVMVASRTARRA